MANQQQLMGTQMEEKLAAQQQHIEGVNQILTRQQQLESQIGANLAQQQQQLEGLTQEIKNNQANTQILGQDILSLKGAGQGRTTQQPTEPMITETTPVT